MATMKEMYLDFISSDDCVMCGSQRCSASPHEVMTCNKWNSFCNNKIKSKQIIHDALIGATFIFINFLKEN